MFGIDLLAGGALLTLAAADTGCRPPKPAEINVKPRTAEVEIITDKSLDDLQGMKTDTVDPHSFGDMTFLQGLMAGRITMQPSVRLDYRHHPRSDTVCIWYDVIEIDIAIDPKIYIAREVHEDRCMGKATLEHEMKHVKMDREIINKYARIMGRKVYDELKERGFSAGPVPGKMAQSTVDHMQRTVFQIVEHEYKKMELDRIERQRAIDNKEEYDRVSTLCPDFKGLPKSMEKFSGRR